MTAGAATPTKSTSIRVPNVMDEPSNATSANTTSHTGMTALRLNRIDMVVTLLSSC